MSTVSPKHLLMKKDQLSILGEDKCLKSETFAKPLNAIMNIPLRATFPIDSSLISAILIITLIVRPKQNPIQSRKSKKSFMNPILVLIFN